MVSGAQVGCWKVACKGCAGYVDEEECKKLCTLSEEFVVKVSVHQGLVLSPLVLSPLFFILYTCSIVTWVQIRVSTGIIICWWSCDDCRVYGRANCEI